MTSKALSWFRRYALVWYFILTYAISWSFMIPVAVAAQGLVDWNVPPALYYLASFGPMTSALIVTAITEGRTGLGKLLSRLLKGCLAFRYYAFAVLLPFALFALSAGLHRLTIGDWPDFTLLGKLDYLPSLGIPGAVGLWLLTYGMGAGAVAWAVYIMRRYGPEDAAPLTKQIPASA